MGTWGNRVLERINHAFKTLSVFNLTEKYDIFMLTCLSNWISVNLIVFVQLFKYRRYNQKELDWANFGHNSGQTQWGSVQSKGLLKLCTDLKPCLHSFFGRDMNLNCFQFYLLSKVICLFRGQPHNLSWVVGVNIAPVLWCWATLDLIKENRCVLSLCCSAKWSLPICIFDFYKTIQRQYKKSQSVIWHSYLYHRFGLSTLLHRYKKSFGMMVHRLRVRKESEPHTYWSLKGWQTFSYWLLVSICWYTMCEELSRRLKRVIETYDKYNTCIIATVTVIVLVVVITVKLWILVHGIACKHYKQGV